MKQLFIILFVLICSRSQAQCVPSSSNCMSWPNSELAMNTPTNLAFTFDNFSAYAGGITMTGATVLKVKAQNNPSSTCHWKLKMYIHTNAASGTEWHGTAYGAAGGGAKPALDLLSVRIYNSCGTAYRNFETQNFTNVNDGFIAIIDDVTLQSPGSCNGSEVNTAGSYLTDYGEYSFNVDYIIKPGTSLAPGYYDISVKFCLTE